jgi:hypothetical protein
MSLKKLSKKKRSKKTFKKNSHSRISRLRNPRSRNPRSRISRSRISRSRISRSFNDNNINVSNDIYILKEHDLQLSNSDSRDGKINRFINANPECRNYRQQKYKNVYTISDIHADFRKLYNLTITLGLISSNYENNFSTKVPIGNVLLENSSFIDTYDDYDNAKDNIYNTDLITNITWLKQDTLFIIVGDLIDGSREPEKPTTFYDSIGSFEFLLHAFLFNLRIAALKNNSNVVFTIGNHDHDSIITNTYGLAHNIRPIDIKFFNGLDNRRKVLRPFYECNPFYIFILENSDKTINTIFVHGGLHDANGSCANCDKFIGIQENIIKNGLYKTDVSMFNHDNDSSWIWTRGYSENINICENIENETNTTNWYGKTIKKQQQPFGSDASLIVVGHTPTPFAQEDDNVSNAMKKVSNDFYNKCKDEYSGGTSGCIVHICDKPKIVFVDTQISSAFYRNINHTKSRQFQVLLLQEDTGKKDYKLHRINIDNSTQTITEM